MRSFIVLLLFATGTLPAGNLGHRLGGDVLDEPENTLACYKKALATLQDKKDFHYVEFDIQETADGHAVVYHDTNGIWRLVPRSAHNKRVLARMLQQKIFDNITIQDLTLAEVQRLRLKGAARIPTLMEVLAKSVEWKLRKPMLVEIKLLVTDKCRRDVIASAARYTDKIDINFLAFADRLAKSYPNTKKDWAPLFRKHGFKVYEAFKPKTDKHALIK